MKTVHIYSSGIACCSVCADKDMTIQEVTALVNLQNPTGISSQWKLAKENFATGEPNPHECENNVTKLHYLFIC